MRILEIDNETKTGVASFLGNRVNVDVSLVMPKIGDYALIHAGCAIQIIDKAAAEETLALFGEIEDIMKNER